MPAYFRFLTLLAMKVFLEEAVSVSWEREREMEGANERGFGRRFFLLQVDVAVMEVGMGGAFDCTNVLQCVDVSSCACVCVCQVVCLAKALALAQEATCLRHYQHRLRPRRCLGTDPVRDSLAQGWHHQGKYCINW